MIFFEIIYTKLSIVYMIKSNLFEYYSFLLIFQYPSLSLFFSFLCDKSIYKKHICKEINHELIFFFIFTLLKAS